MFRKTCQDENLLVWATLVTKLLFFVAVVIIIDLQMWLARVGSLFALLPLLALASPVSSGLGTTECRPCALVTCKKNRTCAGGRLRDACNCCDVCAKTEGQECGGKTYIYGRCNRGLTCNISGSKPADPMGTCVKAQLSRPCGKTGEKVTFRDVVEPPHHGFHTGRVSNNFELFKIPNRNSIVPKRCTCRAI